MAFVLVNVDSASSAAGAASIATPGISLSSGSLLVVGFSSGDGTAVTITSITDTAGNQFLPCTGCFNADQLATVGTVDLWYAPNCVGNVGNVVTVNLSASVAFRTVTALQYSGADPSRPFDVGTKGSTTGATSVVSGAFTPGKAGNLNVAYVNPAAAVTTWVALTGGYALRRANSSGASSAAFDLIGAPAGSQTVRVGVDASIAAEISVASFRVGPVTQRVGAGPLPKNYRLRRWMGGE